MFDDEWDDLDETLWNDDNDIWEDDETETEATDDLWANNDDDDDLWEDEEEITEETDTQEKPTGATHHGH